MAMQAGLPALNYAFRGRGGLQRREDYLAAVIAGYSNDYEPLARVLAAAVDRAVDRARRR
jgi:hypothetical protein